jgi:hypothetical protein
LIHKLQTNRKLSSELIIEQYKDAGKRYLSGLIFEMELAQLAESIFKIDQRIKSKRGTKQSPQVEQSLNNMPSHLPRKLTTQETEWHYHLKFDSCTKL